MKTLFLCNIEDLNKTDEGATKLILDFIKNTHGNKIIFSRFKSEINQLFEVEKNNTKFIKIAFRKTQHSNPIFIIDYIKYILKSIQLIIKESPDMVFFMPIKYSHPLAPLHAFALNIISKDFELVFFHKPRVDLVFRIFSRFKIGVISKEIETELKSKGFNVFQFPFNFPKPKKEYNKHKLRLKYGFEKDQFIILHVGHASFNRGLDVLSELADLISKEDQILIVLSSWNKEIKPEINSMISKSNIRVLDKYIKDIYEIYAMADVYVFPIKRSIDSIDIPLSIIEANELNLPIIASNIQNVKNIRIEYNITNLKLINVSSAESMAVQIHDEIKKMKR
jgi:glycosyltransferase involved in cell wall biosynthesis